VSAGQSTMHAGGVGRLRHEFVTGKRFEAAGLASPTGRRQRAAETATVARDRAALTPLDYLRPREDRGGASDDEQEAERTNMPC
jgi:hypothetical protein